MYISYIKVLNRPCRVGWFTSIDLDNWKWHFLTLAYTLKGDNTQTIKPSFKSHEVTSIFSVVSGGMTVTNVYNGEWSAEYHISLHC